jgi:ribokinase
MPAKVLVFGSINTDLVVYVERLPIPGETVGGGTYGSYPGGKGANQAVAAARAGAEVEMFGCLGEDAFGRERISSLEGTGVSTRGVRMIAGIASGIAQITVDSSGENTIAVAPGANACFVAEGVDVPPAAPGETCVSLFQNEVPQEATEELILRADRAGHVVLWNLAPTLSRTPSRPALRAVRYLLCNLNELSALAGERLGSDSDLRAVSHAANGQVLAGVRNVIVTMGRKGSLWVSADGLVPIAAFAVEAVDTVGAGDCYCGVFAASLAQGLAVREALHRASAAAALSTTRMGAQTSMPLRGEIDDFLTRRGG